MNKYEFKNWIATLFFVALSVLVYYLFGKYVFMPAPMGAIYIGLFFIYVFFVLWISSRYSKTTNKILKVIILIISAPFAIVMVIFELINPMTTILMSLILYSAMSAIFPSILTFSISAFYPLSMKLAQFIVLSFTSIIAIAFHKYILKIIVKMIDKLQNNPIENEHSIDLIKYIFKLNNIRFLIYIAYFLYIVFYSISLIKLNSDIHFTENNIVVLQAFLVFLAFDNILINSNDVRFLASYIMDKYFLIIGQNGIKSGEEKTKTPPSSS